VRKPLIGVTSNVENITALSNSSDEFVFVRCNYISAVVAAGGIPVVLNSKIDHDDASHLVERLDGILFIGGQDVDPSFYGEQSQIDYCATINDAGTPYNRPLRDKPNPERDRFEIALYLAAKAIKLPIVGVCRGYQLINVAEGGSLFQEIPLQGVLHTTLPNEIIPNHEIIIQEGSHAHQVFGSTCFMTCSIHHQGIKQLGRDLIATGFAKDGLTEVVEGTDPKHFLIGMQGHPERSCKEYSEHNSLFSAFIDACHAYRSKQESKAS
jgi:putative glutamine amidotransferase